MQFSLWYCRWALHSPQVLRDPYGNRLVEVTQLSLIWTQRKRKEAILVENELFPGHHSVSLLSELLICINYTLYFFNVRSLKSSAKLILLLILMFSL